MQIQLMISFESDSVIKCLIPHYSPIVQSLLVFPIQSNFLLSIFGEHKGPSVALFTFHFVKRGFFVCVPVV